MCRTGLDQQMSHVHAMHLWAGMKTLQAASVLSLACTTPVSTTVGGGVSDETTCNAVVYSYAAGSAGH